MTYIIWYIELVLLTLILAAIITFVVLIFSLIAGAIEEAKEGNHEDRSC